MFNKLQVTQSAIKKKVKLYNTFKKLKCIRFNELK